MNLLELAAASLLAFSRQQAIKKAYQDHRCGLDAVEDAELAYRLAEAKHQMARREAGMEYLLNETPLGFHKVGVGETLWCDSAAPGVGHTLYLVTRCEDNGLLYGVLLEDTIRVLDPDEVI